MAKNPYFRVLALTATPGSNPEAVQLLIDGLHVSRIDIRDENSLDLKPFIHHKASSIVFSQEERRLMSIPLNRLSNNTSSQWLRTSTKSSIFLLNLWMYVIRSILFMRPSCLRQTDMKPLRQRGVLFGSPDPVKMHPYAAQARMSNLNRDQRWAYGPLARLSSLARAMGYLVSRTSPTQLSVMKFSD